MKGLILKDCFLVWKYYKLYFLLTFVFLGLSVSGQGIPFLVYYPCMLFGMVPTSLQNFDEQSKWDVFCGALPVTKAQIVSSKYLTGLICQGSVAVLIFLAQLGVMAYQGGVTGQGVLALIVPLVLLNLLPAAVSLPFVFALGSEKGRMAQLVTIGIFCGGCAALAYADERLLLSLSSGAWMPGLSLLAVGVYGLSWWLSVRFYEKREIR